MGALLSQLLVPRITYLKAVLFPARMSEPHKEEVHLQGGLGRLSGGSAPAERPGPPVTRVWFSVGGGKR